MATLTSILEASRMPDEKRIQSQELRSSIEGAVERRKRQEQEAVAAAVRQEDEARRSGATRMVDFYLAEGRAASAMYMAEPRLDVYYSSVDGAGGRANAGVEAMYTPRETTRAKLMKAHGLQAWRVLLERSFDVSTPGKLRAVTAEDLVRVAALQRPALRMNETKAEELLTALRRVAQDWAEMQRQSLAWRPDGPAVLWASPVAMASPVAFHV